MRGAEEVNRRLEESRPWDLAKDDSKRDELAAVCSAALRAYFRLAAALAPATPRLAQESARLFGVDSLTWDDVSRRLETGRKIAPFRHLLGRVEKTMIDNLLAANRAPTNDAPAPAAVAAESFAPEISLDDFLRARIVVARVVAADPVAGADKLLRLILDIGEARRRTVFAGIKAHYIAARIWSGATFCIWRISPRARCASAFRREWRSPRWARTAFCGWFRRTEKSRPGRVCANPPARLFDSEFPFNRFAVDEAIMGAPRSRGRSSLV